MRAMELLGDWIFDSDGLDLLIEGWKRVLPEA